MQNDMHPEIHDALSRSAVYSALSMAFGPPSAEVTEQLVSPAGQQHLRDALDALGIEVAFEPATADTPTQEVLARRYQEIFGHTARGEVVPYETEYGKAAPFLQPHELADLGGFLAAFGLDLNPDQHERIDHVRCECEFMSWLARKEAHALETEDKEMLETTRTAQRLFLRDHLGQFAPAFGTCLSQADGAGFFGTMGRIVARFVTADCKRVGVPAGTDDLALHVVENDETPIACGEQDCDPQGCPT